MTSAISISLTVTVYALALVPAFISGAKVERQKIRTRLQAAMPGLTEEIIAQMQIALHEEHTAALSSARQETIHLLQEARQQVADVQAVLTGARISLQESVSKYEERILVSSVDTINSFRSAISTFMMERHQITVSDEDWHSLVLERAIPSLIAKLTADEIIAQEQRSRKGDLKQE